MQTFQHAFACLMFMAANIISEPSYNIKAQLIKTTMRKSCARIQYWNIRLLALRAVGWYIIINSPQSYENSTNRCYIKWVSLCDAEDEI
jgi:hypothetical protein